MRFSVHLVINLRNLLVSQSPDYPSVVLSPVGDQLENVISQYAKMTPILICKSQQLRIGENAFASFSKKKKKKREALPPKKNKKMCVCVYWWERFRDSSFFNAIFL